MGPLRERVLWLFSLLSPYKGWILLGGLLAGLTVLGNVGLLATSAILLSEAALMPPLLWLLPLITGVRFFGISRAVLRYAERLLNHSIAYRILGGLRVRLYEHLEKVVPDRLIGYSEGMLHHRLVAGIDVLQYFYLRAVSLPFSFVMVLVSSCFFISFFSTPAAWVLAAGMLIAGIVVPLATRFASRSLRVKGAEISERLAEELLDLRLGLADLTLHPEARDLVAAKIEKHSNQLGHIRLKSDGIAEFGKTTMDFIGHATMLLAILVSLPLVSSGQMSGVYLAMVGMVCLGAFEVVQAMPKAVVQMGDSLEAANALKAVEDIPAPETFKTQSQIPSYDIHLAEVAFHYHQEGASFVRDISIDIPHGRHIALTGRSGSGKSSLAKIIAGLWSPDAGEIRLGGVPYTEIGRDQLTRRIAYLEQNPTIFHASLKENLLLANPKASEKELWDVLTMVGLKELAESLPQGLLTSLGEGGDRLSGGQRQRVAAARLLLQDPEIVILDEPGQNLDRRHADALLSTIRHWARDKTLILITHRLEDLPDSNFIYVLSHGKIAEKGSYKELMSLPQGQLRALVELAKGQQKEDADVSIEKQ